MDTTSEFPKKECSSSPSGMHEWVSTTAQGEICKHCKIERGVAAVPIASPFAMDAFGNVVEMPPEVQKMINETLPPLTDKEIEERLERKGVSSDTFKRILDETQSEAAIIITFDTKMTDPQFIFRDFHISVVNVAFNNVKAVLSVVVDALFGKLGGNLNLGKGKK